jgi:haloacid dehalogenase superfamily, subfamily IA, variant 1 with third motif having Dx(3-4)D or Dx(3-4)E
VIKAIFIDFYGTVVHEDGDVIKVITPRIYETGNADKPERKGVYWWNEFQAMCTNSYGDHFETQRSLEYKSLIKTIAHFKSDENAKELSDLMFENWVRPPIFQESKEFFKKSPVPTYIISNIDKNDIQKALKYHGLKPVGVFTSEDAKSYKPRKELFELALKKTGLYPKEVVHIGDSISSDVKGAEALNIRAIWVNRFNRETHKDIVSVRNLLEVYDRLFDTFK